MRSLIPWADRMDVTTLRREMDRVFDRFFDGRPFRLSAEGRDWAPCIDVSETAKNVVVQAEVPGMDAKDIAITITGNILTIRGERKQEKEEKEENFHRIERNYGVFSRSISLPAEVETDKVDATYKDGVLKITMSKTKKASQKRIEVKSF